MERISIKVSLPTFIFVLFFLFSLHLEKPHLFKKFNTFNTFNTFRSEKVQLNH